ncbi:MAG TPA: hypothetical protein VHX88_06305 [Solirubrobacteraceae bacterium]|nr:hypothetical protein [Solirubrobacteraceae bacterium]
MSRALMAAGVVGAGFAIGAAVEKHDHTAAGGTPASARRTAVASTRDAPGAANAQGVTGTVKRVDGSTVYLTEPSGKTVAVRLAASAAVTRSDSVSHASIDPGDTIAIGGSTSSGGVRATSISDLGDSNTTATASG